MQCDPVTMHPPAAGKRFQHQEIEGPLKAIVGVLAHRSPIASYWTTVFSGLVRCQASAAVPMLYASSSMPQQSGKAGLLSVRVESARWTSGQSSH